jgi:hypothetical protein
LFFAFNCWISDRDHAAVFQECNLLISSRPCSSILMWIESFHLLMRLIHDWQVYLCRLRFAQALREAALVRGLRHPPAQSSCPLP